MSRLTQKIKGGGRGWRFNATIGKVTYSITAAPSIPRPARSPDSPRIECRGVATYTQDQRTPGHAEPNVVVPQKKTWEQASSEGVNHRFKVLARNRNSALVHSTLRCVPYGGRIYAFVQHGEKRGSPSSSFIASAKLLPQESFTTPKHGTYTLTHYTLLNYWGLSAGGRWQASLQGS